MSSLANNYRPLTFANLIGQDVMVETISNAIKLNRVADAFLLTGPHGTGKTSAARIIAKSLNCEKKTSTEPCMQCSNCNDITKSIHTDVLEMDAASNTSVGDIRAILESAKYLPSQARCKVYIVDEVHMLSNSAFNALLKTLEEPYNHVKFILATTELNKVPATIISRCQRFHFKRINNEKLANYLQIISERGNVNIAQGAAMLIAQSSEGSVRDAISILEQLILYTQNDHISIQDVQTVLGLSDEGKIILLLNYITDKDTQKLLKLFHSLYSDGGDPIIILHEILEIFHTLTRIKVISKENYQENLVKLATRYSIELLNRLWQALLNGIQSVKIAPSVYNAAEMVLLRLCHLSSLPSPNEVIKNMHKDKNITDSQDVTEQKILKLCEIHGELVLYEHLITNLRITNINYNTIKLELIAPINSLSELKKKLVHLLNLWNNQQWKLEIIDKSKVYPVVNKVMQEFNNAKITNIKRM